MLVCSNLSVSISCRMFTFHNLAPSSPVQKRGNLKGTSISVCGWKGVNYLWDLNWSIYHSQFPLSCSKNCSHSSYWVTSPITFNDTTGVNWMEDETSGKPMDRCIKFSLKQAQTKVKSLNKSTEDWSLFVSRVKLQNDVKHPSGLRRHACLCITHMVVTCRARTHLPGPHITLLSIILRAYSHLAKAAAKAKKI